MNQCSTCGLPVADILRQCATCQAKQKQKTKINSRKVLVLLMLVSYLVLFYMFSD